MNTTSLNTILSKLKIETLGATILGLLTVGGYWLVLLRKWLVRNQEYKEALYNTKYSNIDCKELINNLDKRTKKNLKFGKIIGIMLIVGIVIFLIEVYVELYTKSNPLFDEELFWFYVWLAFSLFGLWLHAIALQIKNTWKDEKTRFDEEQFEKPWLLKGDGSRIYIMAILNIILALGLLPFVIFPPILGSAINRYIKIEEGRLIKGIKKEF